MFLDYLRAPLWHQKAGDALLSSLVCPVYVEAGSRLQGRVFVCVAGLDP
jgi:hypothetical protein